MRRRVEKRSKPIGMRKKKWIFLILIVGTGIVSCSNPLQEIIEKDIEQKYSAISVYQGAAAIASGSTFHFGSAVKETAEELSFSINNTGEGELVLTGTPKVSISGSDSGDFSIAQYPSSPVPPDGSTSFIVRLYALSAGSKTITITILNNDPDKGNFSFTVSAAVTDEPEPEISVTQGGTEMSGSGYSFGRLSAGETSGEVTFTISNLGTAELQLTGTPNRAAIGGGSHPAYFETTSQPQSPLSEGDSTTFKIRFVPPSEAAAGTKTAIVTIPNNDADESSYTFELSGWISPEAPTALSAVSNTISTAELAWTDNADDEEGYRIERKKGTESFAQIADIAADSTSYEDTGLLENTTYTYRVCAYVSAGISDWSNEASATTKKTPNAPTGLSCGVDLYSNEDAIELSWNDTSSDETGFTLQYKAGAEGTWTGLADLGPNEETYTHDGLPTATYYYRIRAFNDYGTSAWSAEDSILLPGWVISTITTGAGSQGRVSIAMDTEDNPHVSYCDTVTNQLRYAAWDGGSWNIENVDAISSYLSGNSLAIDSSGTPHIAYNTIYQNGTKYARWDGDSWNIETVDAAGQQNCSIALSRDSNEYPRIAYRHYDSETYYLSLKYAVWDGDSWNIETVDAGASSIQNGYHPTLRMSLNNMPVIVHGRYLSSRRIMRAAWNGTGWAITQHIAVGDTNGWNGSNMFFDLNSSDTSCGVYFYSNLKWCQNTTSYDIYTDFSCSAVETSAVPDSMSFAVSPSGEQHIAYGITGSGGQFKYHTVRYTAGGKHYGVPIDSTSEARASDIAFDSQGRPQIVYLLNDGTLKIARWME